MNFIRKSFELTKTNYSKEKYLNAAKNLDKIIKVLLLVIVFIEIIINYNNLGTASFEIYIYNMLFPFTMVYSTLFVRSYRAEKEALIKKTRNLNQSKIKNINSKSQAALEEILKMFSDIALSVIVPYYILLFSNNLGNMIDLIIIVVLFALSILSLISNLCNKHNPKMEFLISLAFLIDILFINIRNIFSMVQDGTHTNLLLLIFTCFIIAFWITNKSLKR